jgi:hypothetical protein
VQKGGNQVGSFFLTTFYVGFGLTALSLVLGLADLGGKGGPIGKGGPTGGLDVGDASLDLDLDIPDGPKDVQVYGKASAISPVNFQTIVAFVMGFGGVGYVLTQRALAVPIALAGAAAGGYTIAWLIYRFLKLLVRGETPMPSTSYVGLAGRLTLGIRAGEGATGEMVYSRHGTRMVCTARSARGEEIAKGDEVVVLRYEKGIAYVEPLRALLTDPN